MVKQCPFGNKECSSDCSLYVNYEELNELMAARLSSLGVVERTGGTCSFKMMAMSSGRYIFEHTTTKRL